MTHACFTKGALALAIAASVAGSASAQAAATAGLELEHKTLQSKKGLTVQADAGKLMVPENRSKPGSRLIPIAFLRLKSTSATPKAPLFYLAGGPGDRGVPRDPAPWIDVWSPLLAVSDVVLIDQRGVSDPDLQWSWDGPPPLAFFANPDSALAHIQRMTRRAAMEVRGRGVDLAGYNTAQSAADLDALRAALGIERVSLLGFSYGTHLACAYVRNFGNSIENAVFLGLEGPAQTQKLPWTMDVQFQKLALLAAQDPRIAGQVPDLLALYDRVIAKLAKQPMVIPVPDPSGKDTLQVPIGPFGLRLILRFDVGDATDLIVFPRLLWSIDQGDPSVLAWFVRKRAGAAGGTNAMSGAMDAASGISPARLALIAEQAKSSRFADVVNFPYPEVIADWGVPDLGEDFRKPVVSLVRMLLVSGELDFNTPPSQSEEFRWGAPNATHLVVANAGHEQTFWQNDTAINVIADFLGGKDVSDRRISYRPLRFVPLTGSDPQAKHPSVGD